MTSTHKIQDRLVVVHFDSEDERDALRAVVLARRVMVSVSIWALSSVVEKFEEPSVITITLNSCR
jgi:hypothetical protein